MGFHAALKTASILRSKVYSIWTFECGRLRWLPKYGIKYSCVKRKHVTCDTYVIKVSDTEM
jgi:hypothetical protein